MELGKCRLRRGVGLGLEQWVEEMVEVREKEMVIVLSGHRTCFCKRVSGT